MSTRDFIKKSVLENFTQYSTPKLWVALLAALLMGVVIYLVYRRFYTGVVFSRSFAVTLVGMSVLTCMVTLAISTNVVISLGMVGALSMLLFYHWQERGRVYIAVIHYTGQRAGDDIVRAFGRNKYVVKSKTMRGDTVEMVAEVFCKDKELEFSERLRAVPGVADVTLIQYNGEYHG